MIFGRPGSGKSTFAILLARSLGLPIHHLDKHFYINDWIERDHNEFLKIQKNIIDTECWIVDGNNIHSLEMRWARSDLVLYFNFPKIICYFRIFKRFLKPNKSFDDRAPGCKETLRLKLLKYMWEFEERVSKNIEFLKKTYTKSIFREIRCNNDLIKLRNELLGKL